MLTLGRDLAARGDLKLDPDYFGGSAFALLAKRGWGKTYAARVIAEELWPAKIPFVFIDPMDVAWGLRAAADGKGDGIPVPIFGGAHADAPLEPTGGKLMADLVVDEGVSMVLSLKHFGSRSAERRFAMDFLERLYRRNRDLVHLLIDEADLFAPQNPRGEDGKLLAITENIVRRGRNNGLGCTLMTQRPAVLSKDVLNQVDGLVVGRMVGPLDRDAIDGWVKESGDLNQGKLVKATLPDLQNGESWWWIPEQGVLKRVQIRPSRTFDSSPTKKRGQGRREPKGYADVDMGAVEAKMADTIERAKKEDPRELRRQIVRLESELAKRPTEKEEVEVAVEVPVPILTDEDRKLLDRAAAGIAHAAAVVLPAVEKLGSFETPRPASRSADGGTSSRQRTDRERRQPTPPPAPRRPTSPPSGTESPESAVTLKKGARQILTLLCSMHPQTLSRKQIAQHLRIRSGGSTLSSYTSNLRTAGLVYDDGDRLGATQAGFDYLGEPPPPPPTAQEIIDRWREKLKRGAREMLNDLIDAYPRGLDRVTLAEQLDIDPGGSTFSSYLSNLRTAELIDDRGSEIYLAENLGEAL